MFVFFFFPSSSKPKKTLPFYKQVIVALCFLHILTKCLKTEDNEYSVTHLCGIKPDTFVNEIQLCKAEHRIVESEHAFFYCVFLLLTDIQVRKVLFRLVKHSLIFVNLLILG